MAFLLSLGPIINLEVSVIDLSGLVKVVGGFLQSLHSESFRALWSLNAGNLTKLVGIVVYVSK